ncbi:MAG: DMT family transporter [Sphingomonadales bacterium]|nr:MAG: DMT family transporter [Sphingomonadales bacterium]
MSSDMIDPPSFPARLARRLWAAPYVLLTCTALFWAGNSIVGRGASELVPPLALAFWRWSGALLLVLPLAWPHLRRDAAILRSSWRTLLILGTLGIGAFNTILYIGLQTTSAVNGLLLQSLQPGLILLFGAILFAERTRIVQILGLLLSIAGALTILSRGDLSSLVALRFNGGDLVIAGAVIIWSLYSVLLRKRPQVHPLSFLAATFAIGVVVLLPFYVAEVLSGRLIESRTESWLAIGYVCIFPSLIANLCYNRGVELVGSAAAGLYLNIMPIMGAFLAMIFLGEAIRPFHLAGIALVAVGIACATGRWRRTHPPEA